jgi:hypothetical protein
MQSPLPDEFSDSGELNGLDEQPSLEELEHLGDNTEPSHP